MIFESEVQPLCRYCGKGLKKETHTVYFGQNTFRCDTYSTYRTESPRSKEEAQGLLNGTIVSVRRDPMNRDVIWQVTTWDGVSWQNEFFCNNDHARWFADAAARAGQGMPAYHEAVVARNG